MHPYFDRSSNTYAVLNFYDDQDRLEYLCETLPKRQLDETKPCWRILKKTYDGVSDLVIRERWANSSSKFEFSPALRETYTY